MKRVNIHFLFSMIIALFVLCFTIAVGVTVGLADRELDNLKSELDTSLQDDEIDDVEGYGIIVQGIGYGLGTLVNAVAFVLAILAGFYALLLFLFAIVAKCIFAPSGGRLLAYRILMGIEYALQVGIVYFLGSMLINSFSVPLFLLTLIPAVGTTYCVINTYSGRLLGTSKRKDRP